MSRFRFFLPIAALVAGSTFAAEISLFPAERLYPASIAGPLEPRFGVTLADFSATDIDDTGDQRLILELGGVFDLVEIDAGGTVWHIGLAAGFRGQFDQDHSQDNVGWDGIYGLQLQSRLSDRLAVKLGAMHTSAHIGDELAERTGRERIGYTREEAVAGLSWNVNERFRAYVEGGYGYVLRDQSQEPLRGEAGLEWVDRPRFGRFAPYAAIDFGTFEERDWKVDIAAQAGLMLTGEHRRWRVGVAYQDGRTPLGEFFEASERSIALGVWMEQ